MAFSSGVKVGTDRVAPVDHDETFEVDVVAKASTATVSKSCQKQTKPT